jgi:hypothetical protein
VFRAVVKKGNSEEAPEYINESMTSAEVLELIRWLVGEECDLEDSIRRFGSVCVDAQVLAVFCEASLVLR